MESIFTKIVKGKIPCYKVAETEDCLAFLDTQPLAKGHTLVIPKKRGRLLLRFGRHYF
jgi:histidine triad (HIT) family protein